MTATKGPIERIRKIAATVACETAEGDTEHDMACIQSACDELAAQQDAYVERHPEVWMLTTAQSETVLDAITEALRIIDHSEGDGAALAKIAREWMASKQTSTSEQMRADAAESLAMIEREWRSASLPRTDRIDNGDGTVTFPCVPVTVPAAIVADGSTVLGVRVPKLGERYVMGDDTQSRVRKEEGWLSTELRLIVSDPPAPQFRAGGYYRTKSGDLIGPIKGPDEMHAADWETLTSMLEPGEVTVWQPPASMPAEVWTWRGDNSLLRGDEPYVWRRDAINRVWRDWTDPPKTGRYKVPGNGKIAIWEGDA